MKNLIFALLLCVSSAFADIGNGIETTDFSPVVHLKFNWGTGVSQCTATQVRPGLLLTAAHCMCNPKGSLIGVNNNWLEYAQVIMKPGYICDDINATRRRKADIAVIHVTSFDPIRKIKVNQAALKDLEKVGSYYLAKREAKEGETIYQVGFGFNVHSKKEVSGVGIKRYGTNEIEEVGRNFISSNGSSDYEVVTNLIDGTVKKIATGKDVASLGGDSGSPLLSGSGEVLGVMCYSAGIRNGYIESNYLNIYREDIQDFLKSNDAFR